LFTSSTIHSIIIVSVFAPFVTQKIVHLTAAVLSVVYTSNSELSFKCVALVQIVQAHKASFTRVFRLSSFLKFSEFRVSSEFASRIETEPSEKNSSSGAEFVVIISHSLYITQFSSVTIITNSSGLYGRLEFEASYTKFEPLYSLIRL